MAIAFTCACGKALRARDEVAGKKTRCPQCGAILLIPEPQATGYELEQPDPPPQPVRQRLDDDAAFRPPPRAGARPRETAERPEDAGSNTLLEYAYLLLVFSLIPLIVSLLGEDKVDLPGRLEQTMEQATPEEQARALPVLARLNAGEDVTKAELLAAMPGGKLAGAHLAHDSTAHWIYAGIATVGFLMLISLFFSVERVNPVSLFLVGLFTGTIGIVFLLGVQLCSQLRIGRIHGRGIFMLIILLLVFIGWSYRSALDPDSNFLLSAIGFTFGVGLCEEFTKAIPLFFYFKKYAQMGWRGACLWGLASGIGFGVSEGIMYASDHYNGLSGPGIYLVRFISCVGLHAMWSASVGIAIARNVDAYEEVHDFWTFLLFMLRIIAVPMVLHGFYDTLLKQDMNGWALVVALLSFGWLVMHIEMARASQPHAGTGRRKYAY